MGQAFADIRNVCRTTNYKKRHYAEMDKKYPNTFNLWQGGNSKSNVFEYAKDNDGFHPTQKPVALLDDLIKTFSNPGEVVLDICMGSGSTGVACVRTGRTFIGMELDSEYFAIAEKRIEAARLEVQDEPTKANGQIDIEELMEVEG